MSERIIPGVSFTEDTAGLIGTPSAGAMGVLLVGTACKGPLTPQYFGAGQLADILNMYGPTDPYKYKNPSGNDPKAELTLVRSAIEIMWAGGPPGGLWICRIAETGAVTSVSQGITVSDYSDTTGRGALTNGTVTTSNFTITVSDTTGYEVGDMLTITSVSQPTLDGNYFVKSLASTTLTVYKVGDLSGFSVAASDLAIQGYGPVADGVIRFTAKYPGQWYNNAQFQFAPFQDVLGVEAGAVDTFRIKIPSNQFYDGYIDSTSSTGLRSLNRWYYKTVEVQLNQKGGYARKSIADIVTALQGNSDISAYWDVAFTGSGTDDYIDTTSGSFTDLTLSSDTGGTNWSTDDSAIVSTVAVQSALDQLLTKSGRILIIGGCDETVLSGGYISLGIAHVNTASQNGADNERMFFFGTGNYSTLQELISAFESSPYPSGNGRVAHFDPGYPVANTYYGKIYSNNSVADSNTTVALSGAYGAARAAGLASVYAPDQSILNKPIGVTSLNFDFDRSTLERSIIARFATFAKSFDGSFVVRRAITSAPDGDPFAQISTRLAVDDIRYNIRLALQNFIGQKNTARVRQIMNDKLASVMDGYVNRQIVETGYQSEITATRDQEIIGVVKVILIFKVVFYIEFIEVELVLE